MSSFSKHAARGPYAIHVLPYYPTEIPENLRNPQRIPGIQIFLPKNLRGSQRIPGILRESQRIPGIHINPHKSTFFHEYLQKKGGPNESPRTPKDTRGPQGLPGIHKNLADTQNVSTILNSVGASGAHTSPTKPAEMCDCTVTQKCPGEYEI